MNSILHQARLHSGDKAEKELVEELNYDSTRRNSFSGSGNRSCGFGSGKKLGAGKWRRTENGEWEKV